MSHEGHQSESPDEDPQQEFAFPKWEGQELKKLAPGYSYNEDGEIVDDKGNIYHPDGRLNSTPAPTELETEIRKLKTSRPELANNSEALTILAKINIAARKNRTSYEPKPYPPLDN